MQWTHLVTSANAHKGPLKKVSAIYFDDKIALFLHNRFSTHFFSMKMAELGGKRLSKLHSISTIFESNFETKTVLLEFQYLQSYDDLLQILA